MDIAATTVAPPADTGAASTDLIAPSSESATTDSIAPMSGDALRFEAFPSDGVFTGRPAPVDLSSDPDAERFRSVLRSGAEEGPNFAGHLTVVSWGCGTACQVYAVVDARTGRIYPQSLTTARGAEYRLESRLLIADPGDEQWQEPDDCASCGTTAYYVWRNDSFEPVGAGPHPHFNTSE